MSNLDEIVKLQSVDIAASFDWQIGEDHERGILVAEAMATFLRSEAAFRAMCEERLERLEAARKVRPAEKHPQLGAYYTGSEYRQIAALKTLLEG